MNAQCLNEAENKLSVSDILANEILQELNSRLFLPRLTWGDRYDSPAQIGDTINVRRVFRAVTTEARANDRQPMISNRVEMKVNIGSKSGIDFHHKDPVMGGEELAALYDIAGGEEFHNGTHYQVGVAGGDLTVDVISKLSDFTKRRCMPFPLSSLLPPEDLAVIAQDIEQHGAPPIAGEVVRERYRGRCREVYLYESDGLPYYEIADYGDSTPLVNAANGYRGSTLPTDGWQSSAKVLNKGQLITIAGVHDVKPRDDYRQLTELKTFVVTDDVTTSPTGTADVPIYPAICDGKLTDNAGDGSTESGGSAHRTCSNDAADNAAITVVGAGAAGENKGKCFRQGFIFDSRAMQYVNVRMEKSALPGVEQGYATDQHAGLDVLYTAWTDGRNLKESNRLDVSSAVKVVHPELAVRVITGEARL